VSAAWCIHNNDLTRLIGQVQEGMGNLRRKIGKPAFLAVINLITNLDFVSAFEDVNGFLLQMMNM
jgi:hypothetical protein